ncbi:M48 family metalloprotease [Iamia sp. SCSIO 61187]|uniref:M48 family metalloprotease n=1 Tax=Iamia sp. SCSIO 61187 TaxID=2722752 RepID=UPI001C632DF3|nr:M48 family metalloprotease [Iamia sp. SCSIO 61187]QYG93410.1 M48 family metalloprotease [Iamia sp. SCSIO 61187]
MDDALELNEARARKLVAVPAATVAIAYAVVGVVVSLVVGYPLTALFFVVTAVGLFITLSINVKQRAPAVALAATGSHPVTEADEPRLHNLVEGLCVGIGLQPPRLRVVEDATANALAVARSVDDADLVVTRGLLDRLSLVELEAVLAHELARIRRGDAFVGVLAGPVLGGGGQVFPATVIAPITRAIVGRGEPIESWSDLAAVEITRYPPGLVAALEKIAEADPSAAPPAEPSVAHLWIHGARPEGPYGEALSRVYEAPPPVGQRIEVLEEL